jgi:DNA invertase Pin-like site-specific DNA recombinase
MPVLKDRTAARPNHAVLYARVSSKDQEREGYSIPAQERLIRDYAIQRGLVIVDQFVDVETAKRSGRTAFTAMLEYLKKHRATCRTILVEKTDRLYRNLKDWTTLDDLGASIHLVKEARVIGPDSRSSDQLAHGISVLMARNYILNLGEETRKGMSEKARAGIYPSYAPVGYRNVIGPNGKRTIAPDPVSAPVVKDIFERFAAGSHSVKSLVKELNAEGIQLRGHRLHSSLVHQILRKRLYTGDFDWDGTTYTGIYEQLMTRECWQRV